MEEEEKEEKEEEKEEWKTWVGNTFLKTSCVNLLHWGEQKRERERERRRSGTNL